MSRIFRILINQRLLREHIEREDREFVSEAEIRCHLIDAGFAPQGEHWIVAEKNLGFLKPEEVTTIELLSNGTTRKTDEKLN